MRLAAGPASLRLTLSVAAGIIAIALAAMVVQYRMAAQTLEARQAELLRADVGALAALYEQRRIPAVREALEFRAATADPAEAIFLLEDRERRKLAGNLAGWPASLPLPAAEGLPAAVAPLRFDASGTAYQGIALLLPGGFPLLIARGTGEVDRTLAALRSTIAAVAAALVVVALLAGHAVARSVMRRIDRLNGLADRVAAGDLSARLPGPRASDEFGALETHVHAMLDRIANLNRATHRLSDSIAHELRTPLNRIMQKLAALDGDDRAVEAIEAEMRGTIRIFDSLLDISAAEAQSGTSPGLVPVDLSALVSEVFDLYQPLAEDQGLAARAEVTAGLAVLGDRNLIAQLLSNLLDNAIKFTPPGESVTLTLADAGATALLSVADTGPGLPDDIRAAAFERFVRAERDRGIRGHGLGLPLVQAIATRHGARLTLPPVPRGLTVTIAWPKLPPSPPG